MIEGISFLLHVHVHDAWLFIEVEFFQTSDDYKWKQPFGFIYRPW
jgi:hypothetical protein